jgi:hypothetical protein
MTEPATGRTGRVHQVNVSKGGVPKLPVAGVRVHRLGLEGDGHDEPEPIHRGVDQAVSPYCVELSRGSRRTGTRRSRAPTART